MTIKTLFQSVSVGVAAVVVSAIAQPADAFIITNTSASWDNVTLNGGGIVGSQGVAADDGNTVSFLEADGISQVRWGSAVHGEKVVTTRDFSWNDYYRGHSYYYGHYTSSAGRAAYGYYMKDVKTISTYRNQSGLGYKGVSDLDLAVDDVFNLGTLTHFNQTIWSNNFIGKSAEFSLKLDFEDNEIGSQKFDFTFSIDETPNSQAVCPYQTSAGKGCSDKIQWDFALDQKNTFEHDDKTYSLELVGFGTELAGRGIVSDFISQENGDNSASLFARIVQVDMSRDIPEPTSLLSLLGVGVYFAHSRKKKVSKLAA